MQTYQILMLNAALIAGLMTALWLVSLQRRDASVVDVFWGLGFVVIAWSTFAFSRQETRALTLALLTTLWGLRLAGYLAWRNSRKGEDPRYAAMREQHGNSFWWISLFTVFGLQGVVMWIIALPIQVGQTYNAGDAMSLVSYAGIGVWVIGFMFESIGDLQLAQFKADPANAGKVMDRGLWRYTRHPNYFGNAMIWWGLFLVSVTTSSAWLIVSPLLMNFLLLKVSGVALLERSLAKRSAAYRDYVHRTSPFIPRPPKASTAQSNTATD